MHCLPAYCGKEIDEETFEANADTIFTQAENRLHVQKAILNWAVSQQQCRPRFIKTQNWFFRIPRFHRRGYRGKLAQILHRDF